MRAGMGRAVLVLAGVCLAIVAGADALWVVPAYATGRLSYPFPTVYGVSCPSAGLCVAVDKLGDADVSTDPSAARPTWTGSKLVGLLNPMAVSCASTMLCVAVDFEGRVAVSTDPTAATPTWRVGPIGGGVALMASVSCPSASLCVAVDGRGDVATTTDPTVATPTWTVAAIDSPAQLRGVSCASTTLCVAVDNRGDSVISTDPASASPAWSAPVPIDNTELSGVSCPSSSLCVAADAEGRTVRSTDPSAPVPSWSAPSPAGASSLTDISCPGASSLCVSVVRREHATGQPTVGALTTTEAAAPVPLWHAAPSADELLTAEAAPARVSCASTSLCVLVSGESATISTNPLAANPNWTTPAPIVALPAGTPRLLGAPTIRGTTLTFGLGCTAEFVEECRGAATVATTERLAPGGRRVTGVTAATRRTRTRSVVIGMSTFATGFGGSGKIYRFNVALNTAGRRLLARFKRLPATLTVTAAARELRVPPKTVMVKIVKVMFGSRTAGSRKRRRDTHVFAWRGHEVAARGAGVGRRAAPGR